MKVKIKKLHRDAIIPKYATEGSAGFDLVAMEDMNINPGKTELVKTGLSIEIPKGYELQIRPRSGNSLKTTLRVANAPGTVDSDYRGEICVIVTNQVLLKYPSTQIGVMDILLIRKGDKIAQGVICPIIQAEFEEVEDLSSTTRGAAGFGSTGK